MDQTRPPDGRDLADWETENRAASAASLATPREWPATYGDFISTRSAIASRT